MDNPRLRRSPLVAKLREHLVKGKLRKQLRGEVEAASSYGADASAIEPTHPAVAATFRHIRGEEREHAAELRGHLRRR